MSTRNRNTAKAVGAPRTVRAAAAIVLGLASLALVAQPSAQERRIIVDPAGAGVSDAPRDGANDVGGRIDGSMFVRVQHDNEISADNYIGHAVINTRQEQIGDINDLVFDPAGGIRAVVIGVGGFLGIGEKNVAVRFDAIEVRQDPSTGELALVLNATEEELERAPEYVTVAMRIAEEQAARAARQSENAAVKALGQPTPSQ